MNQLASILVNNNYIFTGFCNNVYSGKQFCLVCTCIFYPHRHTIVDDLLLARSIALAFVAGRRHQAALLIA